VRIDVFFHGGAAGQSDLSGRVVLVIDVLRASTTIATALHNGARAVVPFEGVDEATARARTLDRREVILAGERRMVTVPGFDLGNSPREFTGEVVAGKTILLTTTNGTAAMVAPQGAAEVVIGAFVNYTAVLALLRGAARAGTSLSIVCAGSGGRFTLEDAVCAGRFVRGVSRRGIQPELGDAARVAAMIDRGIGGDVEAMLRACDHGRELIAAGYEADLAACAGVDTHPVVPVLRDRQLVPLAARKRR
jgi:2-phosphosulfolactate phosphatase